MSQALICDLCGTTFAARKKDSQDVNITEYEGEANDKGYDYHNTAMSVCPECAIHPKAE